ncbi:MAG: SDR family oxidoreductase, partial [Rhodothermales bacterium]|nr:SDR family oxidoreductase [Rhodothermales bacterium]
MDGQVHIVIGAAGGIGSAVARMLTKAGASVMLAGRTEESLRSLSAETGASWMACDARSFDHVKALVDGTIEHFG